MSKTILFFLFFTFAILIVGSIHFYFWTRLVANTLLPDSYKTIGKYIIITLALAIPVSAILSRFISYPYARPLLWISYFWLGIMLLLFVILISVDLLKALIYLYSKFASGSNSTADPERRKFLATLFAAGATTIALAAGGIGVFKYYKRAVVKKIYIDLPGLPAVFNGFRIVQISDLHIGQLMTKSRLAEVVEQVNALQPDLIVLTGDLVDGSVEHLAAEISPIKFLRAKKGSFFVTGNHEYISGIEDWLPEIEKTGISILDNKNIEIFEQNDSFYLAGVNDREAKRFNEKHAADFNRALSGLDKTKKKILLAHQPVDVREAANFDVDLVLSGHTHGGQIWPFNYLVYLQQPYLKGFYTYKNTLLYVNQGTGCWGPPMRLGSENEITEIILRS